MRILFSILLLSFLFVACNSDKTNTPPREVIDFNFDWQFYKTQETLFIEDISKIKDWEAIRLPHDWAIETPYNQGYIVTDSTPNIGFIGWYKKEFSISENLKNKHIRLDFDGIYNNSEVYLNGKKINERPYGFSPFSCNLSSKLNFGEINTVTVKVDRRAFLDGRWYNGAGIYRDVKLIITEPVHFKKWGIGISTPKVSKNSATVQIEAAIINSLQQKNLSIKYQILNSSQEIISEETVKNIKLQSKTSLEISEPNLWSPETPTLYTLISTIIDENGKTWDIKQEQFGIRSIKFTPNDGFFLNGEKTYLKGVCLHHDAGGIGVAVPDDVWRRRLKILKEGGVNAIRTAHNTPSENFLNICDELGFLVQDETFDEMDYPKDKRKNYNSKGIDSLTEGYSNHFQKWGERDLKDMLLRDRNHPSIIMWSIGNEVEWTYPRYGKSSGYWNSDKKYYYDEPPITIAEMKENMKNNPPKEFELAKTAQKLSKWVKEIDTTRPVTANLVIPTVSHFSGYTNALDIVGYSYRASVYDYGHRNYPEKMILGTENWANYVEWQSVLDNPFIPGIFLWTGIYYMGETSDVSKRGSSSGLIDFAGFPTARWHQFKTLWNSEPHIYATTIELENSDYINKKGEAIDKVKDQWKTRRWGYQDYNTFWNYATNKNIVVEVYTNCPTAELFLNDKSLGVKKMENFEDHVIKWIVPYNAGVLKVIGSCDKEVVYEIKTAKTPVSIVLTTDKTEINANGYDVMHIEAQLMDANGIPVKHINEEVSFELSGPYKLLATDNGNNQQRNQFNKNTCTTNNGKVLLLIQSTKEKGTIEVKATSKNIISNTVKITVN